MNTSHSSHKRNLLPISVGMLFGVLFSFLTMVSFYCSAQEDEDDQEAGIPMDTDTNSPLGFDLLTDISWDAGNFTFEPLETGNNPDDRANLTDMMISTVVDHVDTSEKITPEEATIAELAYLCSPQPVPPSNSKSMTDIKTIMAAKQILQDAPLEKQDELAYLVYDQALRLHMLNMDKGDLLKELEEDRSIRRFLIVRQEMLEGQMLPVAEPRYKNMYEEILTPNGFTVLVTFIKQFL